MAELTQLLAATRSGDQQSAGQAFSLLYDDLRQHQSFTLLDTTSLVHESYLKLIGKQSLAVEDRRHFLPTQPLSCAQSSSTLLVAEPLKLSLIHI